MLIINLLNWRKQQRVVMAMQILGGWVFVMLISMAMLIYVHYVMLNWQKNKQQTLQQLQQNLHELQGNAQRTVAIHEANLAIKRYLHSLYNANRLQQNRINLFKAIPYRMPKSQQPTQEMQGIDWDASCRQALCVKKIKLKNQLLLIEGQAISRRTLLMWINNLKSQPRLQHAAFNTDQQTRRDGSLVFKTRIVLYDEEKNRGMVTAD